MKTETQIAEININLVSKTNNGLVAVGICASHKASCQRFLEFLEERKGCRTIECSICLRELREKITDLENTIKKYDEVGI